MQKAIRHLSRDEKLKAVIASQPPLKDLPKENVYQSLLRSILSQQLSVKAAATIHKRFLHLFPAQYPAADLVIDLSSETLHSVGLSRQKAGYVQNVATYFLEKNWQDRDWTTISDEAIIEDLTAIKGVGRWTVQMILMFSLGRPDAFPVDDLGIRNAMLKLYGLDNKDYKKKTLYKELEGIANGWRPYRSLACRYLWQWMG